MSDTAHLKAILTLPILLFFSGVGAQAQPAFRVVDLNTTRSDGIQPDDNILTDKDFAALGETVFFAASDGIRGLEPWQTDGTEAGTRPVADICPGVCPSTPQEFTTVGGLVFFVADDGFHKRQLWKSDGTPAGTVPVKSLVSSIEFGGFAKANLRELNGLLLFATPAGLWRSDGTEAGTFLLKPVYFLPLARLGDKLFFIAADPDHGSEVWTTDGTAAGTVLLKDISPGPTDGVPSYYDKVAAVAGGKVFFRTTGGLWLSDGTEAGTVLVKDVWPPSLTALGGKVYFFFSASGLNDDFKLWKSDGTAGGTQPVKTVPPFDSSHVTVAGGRLFFFADCDLWTSDGSEAGTLLVKSGGACYRSPVIGGGEKLLFAGHDVHGLEPWQSDGTPAGTAPITDLYPGSSSSLFPSTSWTRRGTFNNGRWYFLAKSTEDAGTQLWTTDGTAAGTQMLRIDNQPSGLHVKPQGELPGPRAFFDLNGNGALLFQGDDGATGAALWKTDGTAAGTSLVMQPGLYADSPGELTRAGNTVFFRSDAGSTNQKLWKTDGTPAGTQLLLEIVVPFCYPAGFPVDGPPEFSPRDLTPLGNDLLFLGGSPYDVDSLWKTDGTPAGTEQLPLIANSAVSLGDKVLFQADRNALWKSDGTFPGTVSLDATLPEGRWLLNSSIARDGVLFFPGTSPETGEELWQSDGTVAGTHLVAEIVPGPGSKRLGPFATAGPTVFFVAGGNELWKNDMGGTSLVRTLPGDPLPGIRSLTVFRGKAYFSHDDGVNGRELWVSDGTEAGTHLFKDILPGPGSSNPGHLHVEGNILLFSATDGIHSLEPWRSDGTVLGTRMLQDIAPGDLPSSPTEFTASGPYVYFAANDGTTGFELWALPRQSLLATFADVPTDYWAWRFVEALVASGITGGCGPGEFCPTRRVTRAEAAIFLVRAAHGPAFNPPPATGALFQDIPAGHWAGRWIEQLAADGVTSGCGGGNFCPDSPLTRAELAVLLLRARHGSGFVPPPATGTVFNDIPADYWAAPWIERLAAEGAAAGCGGGNYCPGTTISRAEVAVFLGTVFGLPLP
jgi:large repetitive protein